MSDAYNATERSDIKVAQAAVKLADRQDDEVLLSIMRGTAGRAWMFRLLAACHIHQTTFSGDALLGAFKEGERNIGLLLETNLLRVCPDSYISMMREAHARSLTDDTRRRRNRNGNDDAADLSNFVDYSAADGNVSAEPGDEAVERDET